MFTIEMIEQFKKYAEVHNHDCESKEADREYKLLDAMIHSGYEPNKTEIILNILCTTKKNKIDFANNLESLEQYLGLPNMAEFENYL